jgi:hypothetical protein
LFGNSSVGGFGQSDPTSGSLFGQALGPSFGSAPTTTSMLGATSSIATSAPSNNLNLSAILSNPFTFNTPAVLAAPTNPSAELFGSSAPAAFDTQAPVQTPIGGLFGSPPRQAPVTSVGEGQSLFGCTMPIPATELGSPPKPLKGRRTSGRLLNGTQIAPYRTTRYHDSTSLLDLQSISAMEQYKGQSFEELRFADYSQGNRGTASPTRPQAVYYRFGVPSPAGSGLFDTSNPAPVNTFDLATNNLLGSNPAQFFGAPVAPFAQAEASRSLPASLTIANNISGGTRIAPYRTTPYHDSPSSLDLQSISAMEQYKGQSFEELRFADYSQGNRGVPSPTALSKEFFGSSAPAPFATQAQLPVPVASMFCSTPELAPVSNPFGGEQSLFATTSNPGTAFGSAPAQSTGFGASASLSCGSAVTTNNIAGGTHITPYQITHFKDGASILELQSISAMEMYKGQSHEELRFADYSRGNRGTAFPPAPQSSARISAQLRESILNGLYGNSSGIPTLSSFNGSCGTRIAPYLPTHYLEGTSTLKLQRISAMVQYNDKSHEELRFSDYLHGDQGKDSPVTPPTSSNEISTHALIPISGGRLSNSSLPLANVAIATSNDSNVPDARTTMYQVTSWQDGASILNLQSICAMEQYKQHSHEELRFAEFLQGNQILQSPCVADSSQAPQVNPHRVGSPTDTSEPIEGHSFGSMTHQSNSLGSYVSWILGSALARVFGTPTVPLIGFDPICAGNIVGQSPGTIAPANGSRISEPSSTIDLSCTGAPASAAIDTSSTPGQSGSTQRVDVKISLQFDVPTDRFTNGGIN